MSMPTTVERSFAFRKPQNTGGGGGGSDPLNRGPKAEFKMVTELNAAGQKTRTFVYLGNEVLAWQTECIHNDQRH